MATNRIVRIVFNVDLRQAHLGLKNLARSLKINPGELAQGEYVIFINKAQTAIKMFASGEDMLAYWKSPGNTKLELRALTLLPKYFNGGKIDYKAALDERIQTIMKP